MAGGLSDVPVAPDFADRETWFYQLSGMVLRFGRAFWQRFRFQCALAFAYLEDALTRQNQREDRPEDGALDWQGRRLQGLRGVLRGRDL